MASLRPNVEVGESDAPESEEEFQALVWAFIEQLEEEVVMPSQVFSLVITEVFKYSIEKSGSQQMALFWMTSALKDMVQLGPRYEQELHGKVH